MQQAVGLGVALDRHRRDDPLGRGLQDLHAHLVVEGTHARGVPAMKSASIGSVRRAHGPILPDRPDGIPRAGSDHPARRRLPWGCRWHWIESAGARPASTTVTPTRPRLLLLDGHSLAYRAFFALPVENFSTTTGQHTNAVFGFTSMLINVLRDEQPTHIGVAFDISRQTFRSQEYAEYKAKRNKTPDEFSSQLPLIKEVLDALRIQHLAKDGYEADDIIGTLATQALAEGFEVLICSGDRDSFQLVTDHVHGALPDARGLRAGADDARGRRGAVRRAARALPRARGASSARPPTTSRASRASARASPPSGSTSTTGSTTSSPTPTRSPARRASRCASTSATCIRNRRLNALVRDLDLELRPGRPGGPVVGPRSWCTPSSTAWSSGCCATGCSSPGTSQDDDIDDSGFDLSGCAARARARWPAGSPSTPAPARAPA